MSVTVLTPEVLIIGGGPAGLRAAAELAPQLSGEVLVVDREAQAGGIPRHSDHPGYGMRDLARFLTGPAYARRLRRAALAAGARIRTSTTVTEWAGPRTVLATSPEGRLEIRARAVILATGARERPRPARMIPGDRGHGILTTGTLQNLVHLKHEKVGRRAVVVGAELVSWSSVLTLREAGCRTVLMTTEHARPDSYWFFTLGGRLVFRPELRTRTRVTRIIGSPRVTAVEIEDLRTGARRVVECDTVVLTGDWIPDHELARAAGLPLDPVSKAPIVDERLRTPVPGVFAIGNLVHPVDIADVAALDGAAVARHVLDYLAAPVARPAEAVAVTAVAPLRWIAPGRLTLTGVRPPRGRLLAWVDEFRAFPVVEVRQAGRVAARRRVWWPAAPGRMFRIPSGILAGLRTEDGDVELRLRD